MQRHELEDAMDIEKNKRIEAAADEVNERLREEAWSPERAREEAPRMLRQWDEWLAEAVLTEVHRRGPTQQEAEDALYQSCARHIHKGRGGNMPIGEMSIPHLRATIRAIRGHLHQTAYQVVLERKEREANLEHR